MYIYVLYVYIIINYNLYYITITINNKQIYIILYFIIYLFFKVKFSVTSENLL